jgi:hypothetical protein
MPKIKQTCFYEDFTWINEFKPLYNRTNIAIFFSWYRHENLETLSKVATIINNYNASRTDALEKFDYANLELEWWNKAATFKNYLKELQGINAWGDAQTTQIPTETYIGWFQNPTGQELTQATGIVTNTDRVLVHDYQTTPTFSYMQSRLQWLGKAAKAQNKIQKVILTF